PRLAKWCAVYVRSGDVLARVAMEASDPILAERLSPGAAALGEVDLPVVRAFTTQRAQPFEGGISMPMVARGQILGVMILGFDEPTDRPGPQRLYAVTGLAAGGAVALDNAHRLQEEHERAELLTQALLPARMPEIPGLSYATRYVPPPDAGCRDWYDGLILGEGRVPLCLSVALCLVLIVVAVRA